VQGIWLNQFVREIVGGQDVGVLGGRERESSRILADAVPAFKLDFSAKSIRGRFSRIELLNGITPFGQINTALREFVLFAGHKIHNEHGRDCSQPSQNVDSRLNHIFARPSSRHFLFLFLCWGTLYLGIACFVIGFFSFPYFRPVNKWKLLVLILLLAGAWFFYVSHLFFDLSLNEYKREMGGQDYSISSYKANRFHK
jgi:hypothetical protein